MPKFHFEHNGVCFCLDPVQRSLTRNNVRIELQPKTFDLLALLVQKSNESFRTPVSYNHLLRRLWPHFQKPSIADRPKIAQQVKAIHKMVEPALIDFERNNGYFVVTQVRTETAYVEKESQPVPPVHEAVLKLEAKNLQSSFALESPKATVGFRQQGVRGIEVALGEGILGSLKCTIKTDSPYFRFGFKLLQQDSRLLGDAVIVTADNSCVLHIGRNSAPRDIPKISKSDVFLTIYKGTEQCGDGVDRKLFMTSQNFMAAVELRVEHGKTDRSLKTVSLHVTHLSITKEHYREELDSSMLSRVAILVWADGNGCLVKVSDLSCSQLASNS